MSNSSTHVSKWTTVAVLALLALFLGTVRSARAAEFAGCRNRPMVKNLTALRTPPCDVRTVVPQQLTKREVKRLTATAKSPEDHLKLARYYKAEADKLDAEGAGYEEAAAAYRHGPIVKNLMAPNTVARYEYFAKGFREEAKADRKLAASHEQMATTAVATL